MFTDHRLARQRGISFIELVLFMVIIGVALAGILGVINLTTRNSADPLIQKQSLMLAEAFMEEVQLARFTFCDATDDNVTTAIDATGCATPALAENVGPDAGETRPYDNVNDYVSSYGVAAEPFKNGAGALVDAAGVPINLPGYTVQLTITQTALGPAARQAPASAALRIRIAVSYKGDPPLVLYGYRLRYAPNAPP